MRLHGPDDGGARRRPSGGSLFLPAGLVYALALGVRLVFLTQAVQSPVIRLLVVDERINWEMAIRILDGGLRLIPYVRAPGGIYAMAGLAALVGRDPFDVRMVLACIDALSPVMILLIGAHCFGFRAGLAAGLLGAAFWTSVFYSCQLFDASLTCLLCLTLAYLLVRLPDERWWKWLVCGIVTGVGTVARPNLLAFAPILAAVILAKGLLVRRHRTREARGLPSSAPRTSWTPQLHCALLILGSALAIAPVSLRNRIVSGEWILVCFSGGANFWMANNPQADGKEPTFLIGEVPEPLSTSKDADPWEKDLSYHVGTRYAVKKLGKESRFGERDKMYVAMTLDYIRHNPGKFLRDVSKRFCWVFNAYEYPNNKDLYDILRFSPLLRRLSYLHFGVVCPLALLGLGLAIARAPSRNAGLVYYCALIGALVATNTLFVIISRFRLPVACLLLPFAGNAIAQIAQLVRRPRGRIGTGLAWAGGAALLAVFCNANLFGYRWDREPVHLRWVFATACADCGDQELLPEAMARLGQRLTEDADASPRPGSLFALVLRYYHPFKMMMSYQVSQGRWSEAAHYGGYMLRHEPLKAQDIRGYLVFAMETKRVEILYEVLRQVRPVLMKHDHAMLDELVAPGGHRRQDRRSLTFDVRLFDALAKEYPSEARYHKGLEEARSALALSMTTRSTTSPSSRPAIRDTPRPIDSGKRP